MNYLSEGGKYPTQVNEIIEDIFLNLISNAIKYSLTGSLIELSIQDQNDKWIMVVYDFGDGIRDTDKEKLFTRFERLDKEGVKGTGLGLAIAKRIVELHCGCIWVEDNPEGGSIFKIGLFKDGPRKNGYF